MISSYSPLAKHQFLSCIGEFLSAARLEAAKNFPAEFKLGYPIKNAVSVEAARTVQDAVLMYFMGNEL